MVVGCSFPRNGLQFPTKLILQCLKILDPFFSTNRIICGGSSARCVYFCWCKQLVIDITMLFYSKGKLMAVAKKGFRTRKFCLMFYYLCNTVMSFFMFCCTQGNHSFCSLRFDYVLYTPVHWCFACQFYSQTKFSIRFKWHKNIFCHHHVCLHRHFSIIN